MNMYECMRVFVTIAHSGSFTAAAKLLGSTTTNVSKALTRLENRLKTRLINRTTRRLAFTATGALYLDRCERILEKVREAEEEARTAQRQPVGRLKIHTMPSLGTHYVIDAIAKYRKIYPAVTFDLIMTNTLPDLLEEHFDMSVVLARDLPTSGFTAQQLGITYSILCASPDYLEKHGAPTSLNDLRSHDCLTISNNLMPASRWELEGPVGTEVVDVPLSPFFVNTADGMSVAIKKGMGVGVQPVASAVEGIRMGTLVRVLPEYCFETLMLFAIYPSRRFVDAKTRTWLEFLETYIPGLLIADDKVATSAMTSNLTVVCKEP